VSEIFEAMLGLPVSERAVDMDGARRLTACVQISGSWEGAVAVDCTEALARRVAESMLGLAPGEAGPEDVRDAIGEVANVAGGNVKALLGVECALSLPTVTEGIDLRVSVPGMGVVVEVGFVAEGEPVRVLVLEKGES
jgi:chemotaxis protein CheX